MNLLERQYASFELNMPQRALLMLIRLYQVCLSPWLGRQCRFYPSCSNFAAEAVARHGAIRGGRMAVGRVCRCHPFNAGGVDAVPEEI